jgi:hypothetical protein
MMMIASLRPFARSRCLRVMGLLAWLMLVATSLSAAPTGMPMDAAPVHAAASVTGVHCHQHMLAKGSAATAHESVCCSGHAVAGCYCAAMCVSTLPTALKMIAAVPLSARYDMLPPLVAPSPNSMPLLRPPSI